MKQKRQAPDLTKLIRIKARELWEKDGCPPGRDMEYWIKAERVVKKSNHKIG